MSSAIAEQSISVKFGSTEPIVIPIRNELQILQRDQSPPEGFGTMRILNPLTGDDRITWDSRSLDQIIAAKEQFLDFIKQGLTPYRVGVNGAKTSEVMKEFDPKAEEIIFLKPSLVAGG